MQDSTSTLLQGLPSGASEFSANDQVGDPRDDAAAWGPVKRILFRFCFAYFILYIFPFPFTVIPGGEIVFKPYVDLWNVVVPSVGQHLFHLTITVLPNGSGDTTFNYVQVFCLTTIATVVAAIWTVLDRKRVGYPALYRGPAGLRPVLARHDNDQLRRRQDHQVAVPEPEPRPAHPAVRRCLADGASLDVHGSFRELQPLRRGR